MENNNSDELRECFPSSGEPLAGDKFDSMRCALVTGGSGHIGHGIAAVLAENGYDLAVTYAQNQDGAIDTKKQVEALGRRCFVYEAHLDQSNTPEKIVNHARARILKLNSAMICMSALSQSNLSASLKNLSRTGFSFWKTPLRLSRWRGLK